MDHLMQLWFSNARRARRLGRTKLAIHYLHAYFAARRQFEGR